MKTDYFCLAKNSSLAQLRKTRNFKFHSFSRVLETGAKLKILTVSGLVRVPTSRD